jgi:hypothetical protein
VLLFVAYVPLALTFSLLTRAYAGDDEAAHTAYIEYVARHDSIPPIAGGESQQPPLYYFMAAGWQHLLGIPAFTQQFSLVDKLRPETLNSTHHYTPAQHREVLYLHELRLLSILLGLGTVLLAYAGAKVVRVREAVALSSGFFVALLPKELLVSSDVTNDALVIPLCALALVLFLLSERARGEKRHGHRRIYLACMGLTLGAAAVTKLTSLPVAAVLLLLALWPSVKVADRVTSRPSGVGHPGSTPRAAPDPRTLVVGGDMGHPGRNRRSALDLRLLLDGAIVAVGFLATSGWWFIRNKHLYGQFLATRASEKSLGFFAHSVPWSSHLFFVQFPDLLWNSTWFGQLNLALPNWMNDILAVLALLCLAVGAWVILAHPHWLSARLDRISGLALLGCILGGLAALVIHIKTTDLGNARLVFVCLTALAIVLVVGSSHIVSAISSRLGTVGLFVWPIAFLALDLYILVRFLIPLAGLVLIV